MICKKDIIDDWENKMPKCEKCNSIDSNTTYGFYIGKLVDYKIDQSFGGQVHTSKYEFYSNSLNYAWICKKCIKIHVIKYGLFYFIQAIFLSAFGMLCFGALYLFLKEIIYINLIKGGTKAFYGSSGTDVSSDCYKDPVLITMSILVFLLMLKGSYS
jgi:hypothetical protein